MNSPRSLSVDAHSHTVLDVILRLFSAWSTDWLLLYVVMEFGTPSSAITVDTASHALVIAIASAWKTVGWGPSFGQTACMLEMGVLKKTLNPASPSSSLEPSVNTLSLFLSSLRPPDLKESIFTRNFLFGTLCFQRSGLTTSNCASWKASLSASMWQIPWEA